MRALTIYQTFAPGRLIPNDRARLHAEPSVLAVLLFSQLSWDLISDAHLESEYRRNRHKDEMIRSVLFVQRPQTSSRSTDDHGSQFH